LLESSLVCFVKIDKLCRCLFEYGHDVDRLARLVLDALTEPLLYCTSTLVLQCYDVDSYSVPLDLLVRRSGTEVQVGIITYYYV
jgi:hypothetical protein